MPSLIVYLSVLFAALLAPPQASIRPLFSAEHQIVCTANSINGQIGLFLVAQHCKGPSMTIGQPAEDGTWHYHRVTPVYTNDELDIAILYTDTLRVTPLRFAARGPNVDERVQVYGYALGYDALQHTHGTVSNVATPILDHVLNPLTGEETVVDYGISTMYAMPACHGHSGGAILNESGEVVGMTRLGFGPACSPFTAGPTYTTLSATIGKFFER